MGDVLLENELICIISTWTSHLPVEICFFFKAEKQ